MDIPRTNQHTQARRPISLGLKPIIIEVGLFGLLQADK
jgi:hypothetical protein